VQELLRTNDPVRLSFLRALLADDGIDSLVLDEHASILEGSGIAISRRLMVPEDDLSRARRLLQDAGVL